MNARPPRYTSFPYTTLFRSDRLARLGSARPACRLAGCGFRFCGQIAQPKGCTLPFDRLDAHAARRLGLDLPDGLLEGQPFPREDRKSTRLNSSHANISYAVF